MRQSDIKVGKTYRGKSNIFSFAETDRTVTAIGRRNGMEVCYRTRNQRGEDCCCLMSTFARWAGNEVKPH